MPPVPHRFTPSEAVVYIRSLGGELVEFTLNHLDEINIEREFNALVEATEQTCITLKGLQASMVTVVSADGEEKDIASKDWERMILNGIHN